MPIFFFVTYLNKFDQNTKEFRDLFLITVLIMILCKSLHLSPLQDEERFYFEVSENNAVVIMIGILKGFR